MYVYIYIYIYIYISEHDQNACGESRKYISEAVCYD